MVERRKKKSSEKKATRPARRRKSDSLNEGGEDAENGRNPEDVDSEAREEKFWWDFDGRKESLEQRLEKLKNGRFIDTDERQKGIDRLNQILKGGVTGPPGMEELERQDSVDPVPDELARLKRWYWSATKQQCESWVRGEGPNVPEREATPLLTSSAELADPAPPTPRRSDIVWPRIHQAIDESDDSTDAVFAQLRKMALDEESPFTGVVDGKGLRYTDSRNRIKTLTRNAVDKRLKRRAAKRHETP